MSKKVYPKPLSFYPDKSDDFVSDAENHDLTHSLEFSAQTASPSQVTETDQTMQEIQGEVNILMDALAVQIA